MKSIRPEPHVDGVQGDERIRTAVCAPSTDAAYEERCHRSALSDIESRCIREHGHGGAHTARVSSDPYWEYVISWWPKTAERRDA